MHQPNWTQSFSISSWNINGWSSRTRALKTSILELINSDIFVLCETHLSGTDSIGITNYKTYLHSRNLRNRNSRRTFGGLAILFKCDFLNNFDFEEIDKSVDGIYIVKLTEKTTRYSIILIACYLPPERSPWGRDACSFFSYIINFIHIHSCSSDAIYLCGDLNSRLGTKQDFIKGIDMVEDRQVIDKFSNKHGESFSQWSIE